MTKKSCRRVSVMSNSTVNVKGKTTIALTLPDTSHVIGHLILITNLWVRCYYYPHVTDEAAEAQRG